MIFFNLINKLKLIIHNKTYQLVGIVIILCCLSLITIYGVTPQLTNYGRGQIPLTFVIKQGIGIAAGIFILYIFRRINLSKYTRAINIINLILIGMLIILALNPPIISNWFVREINGARGWFSIPGLVTIQPVEFFKITMIFKLASIANDAIEKNYDDFELIKEYLIYGALPILCVLVQPDLGGAILLLVPWLVIVFSTLKDRARVKKVFKFTTISFIIIGAFLVVPQLNEYLTKYTPIKSYQLSRINSWLYPFEYSGGYQLKQSLILMGSAGPFGYGFANNKIIIPEPHTDVIFPEFVGMFGWIMGIILILLYARLLYLCIRVGLIARDYMDKIIVLGFSSLLIVQVFENIGMMLGVLPITGIVLPFMSYGVSALITYFAIIAIITNISLKYSKE